MKFLPENILSSNLSAVDARKLDYFYEQFVISHADLYGKGHLILACYAALPAVLTPDLLYKIWLNFKNYSLNGDAAVIHPVAPADILLSPLVEEIGSELYEMPEQIRKVLLLYLKDFTAPGNNEMQLFTLDIIAEFLKDYISYDFTPENKDDDAFREAQEWTALSYINPGKAFSEVALAFQQSKTNAGRARYKDVIEKMSARFALNIVKDEAAIPKDFKAMTALTSVVRDVLKEGNSEGLKQLGEEALKTKDLLTSVPIKAPNVINIEIPEKVGRKIIEAQIPIPENTGKLKALIVGVTMQAATANRNKVDENNADEKSAELFYHSIAAALPDNQKELNLLSGEKATRADILEAWSELLTGVNPEDNLLFYFAANALSREGHCWAICADSMASSTDAGSFITDEEFGDLTRNIRCASITFILQLDHAATPYWLDTSKPQHIVFASCKFDQEPIFSNKDTDEGKYCMFTYCLADAIKKKGIQLSNRHLFAQAMINYANNESIHISQEKTPQLLCHPEAYDKFFLNGNGNTATLQNLLRQTGYCDEKTTGRWNPSTAYAFDLYCRQNGIQKNLSKQDYINSLLTYQENKRSNDRPIFLLLFSDPHKLLPEIVRERKMIIEALGTMDEMIELIILDDPSKKDLQNVLRDKKNRNRVELFHYSGKDDLGYMILKDGTFNLEEIASMLDFQENIKLFFANTCWSQVFASHITQMGIAYAIGTSGVIYDSSAADFAETIFQEIGDRRDLLDMLDFTEIPATANSARVGNTGYTLFKAGWLSADSKIIWDLNNPGTKTETFSIIVAFAHYKELEDLSATENALLFSAWINTQTKAENCITITNAKDQHEIDASIEQIFSLARKSVSKEKKLFVYMNGRGGFHGPNTVLFLPNTAVAGKSYGLNIEAYLSSITSSGVFDKVILFYDLYHAISTDGYGVNPLFDAKPVLKKTDSLSIGYFSPLKASYEKNSSTGSEGNFTRNLLEGLNGAAAGTNANITANTLRDFITHIHTSAITKFIGSDDFLIAKGATVTLQKVLLHFADRHLNKAFNLLDEALNKINSVLLNQSSLEFELSPGLYIAEIPEAGIRKKFTVTLSSETAVVDLSWTFRDKWIGIIGSGKDLIDEEKKATKSIGIFLAEQGYGLVTGGWPGVDYLTGESYYTTLRSYGIENAGNYLIQIVKTGQEADYKEGTVIDVAEEDWEVSMIQKCAALISIGGRGYTNTMYKRAKKLQHPFIPLPYTGGDSGKIYRELAARQSLIPETFLEQLGQIKTTDEDCISLLKKILDEITATKASKKGPIFMSYSQYNLDYATRLAGDLKNNGEEVFLAAKELKENANYATQKEEVLFEAEYVLVIVSSGSISSRHVKKEITTAIGEGKKIIPVLIEKCEVPDNLNTLSLVDMQIDYEEGLKKILQLLHSEIPATEFSEEEIEHFYEDQIRTIGLRLNLSSKNIEDIKTIIEDEFVVNDARVLVLKEKLLLSLENKGLKNGNEIVEELSISRIIRENFLNANTFLELGHDLLAKVIIESRKKRKAIELIIGADGFYTDHGIRTLIEESANANESNTIISTLLIFQTTKQHTWLAFTRLQTYIILDDANTREKNRLIQTFFDKWKTLPLAFRDSKKGGKVLKFAAQDTWWYYSVKLFPTPESLNQVLEKLLITILWVDDRPDNNRVEREALTEMGFKFDLALTTNEALQKLQSYKYCAIISDMARPEGIGEGYILLEKLRVTDSSTPFFIYASANSQEFKNEASTRGAQGTTNNPQGLISLLTEYIPTIKGILPGSPGSAYDQR